MKFKGLKVLIVSAAGMGNVGDNIVAMVNEGIINDLTDRPVIKYANLEFVHAEVEWADIIIVGGGGIFYDFDTANVDNYLRFIDHAYYMNKPIIVNGIGVQGIKTPYGERRYKESLNLASLITVRDEKDAITLKNIGVKGPVHVTADLAFMWPDYIPLLQDTYGFAGSRAYDELKTRKEGGERLLGITIASEVEAALDKNSVGDSVKNDRQRMDDIKIAAIKTLSSQYTPVLLALSRDDTLFYERIRAEVENAIIVGPLEKDEVLGVLDIYRLFDQVITSRYHGMILSLLADKPTLVLEGSNSEKSKKTINSLIPSFAENNLIQPADIVSSMPVQKTTAQHDETNNAIVQSRKNLEYIKSLLIGRGR